MYARVLRKWSLKTNRMSLVGLVAVTMLLLIICPPTAATVLSFTRNDFNKSLETPSSKIVAITTSARPKLTQSATLANNSNQSVRQATNDFTLAAVAATVPDPPSPDVVEESFVIPVASEEDSSYPTSNFVGSANANRLINTVRAASSSRKSSISSSRSSISKIISSSTPKSSSQPDEQQLPLGAASAPDTNTERQFADSFRYSYYYKAKHAQSDEAAASASATSVAVFPRQPPLKQQQISSNPRDYIDEDELDEGTEESEFHTDDEDDSSESELERTYKPAHVESRANTDARVAGEAMSDFIRRQQSLELPHQRQPKVPNIKDSQIYNLFHYYKDPNNFKDYKEQSQEQQQPGEHGNSMNFSNNLRKSKSRRHIKTDVTTSHHPETIPAPTPATATKLLLSYHSPVRELTTAAPSPNVTAPVKPLRYIIESFEIPASLPHTGPLTEQQRRMLLRQQQLLQQAARNRRDSRAFGQVESLAVNTGSGPFGGEMSFEQQPQPGQQFQRIQQQHRGPTNRNLHRQHRKQHKHHNRQRQRKHARRYCSARDPAQLAFEAPTVFEGKIVSMTPDRRANFSATFERLEVFKQQIGFLLQPYLRLQFAYRNTSGECDIYREQLRARGFIRGDELEQGRIYLMFVQQIDASNFTILGQPIRKTKHVVEVVRNAVSDNYAQLASIRSITAINQTMEIGKELRIICKVQGSPPPKVTWFKDHKSINRNRKLYHFRHFKKKSELIIRSFNISDAGRYECRAKNKVNRNIERRTIVIKAYPAPRNESQTTGNVNNCPDDASEFCFNGGTCMFFSDIGAYSCICPEGFIGERCDRKEVNNMPPSTYSNEQECGEKKFYGSYYC